MTDQSIAPEKPDMAETVNFLRRFSDLMSNGYNAAYLQRAADLLETLTARVLASSDEDELWRYKYENLSRHADALETECEALKNDIEGHLDIAAQIMTERESLRTALQAREAEITEIEEVLNRERDEFIARQEAHEIAMAGLQAKFDREREEFAAKLKAGELEAAEAAGLRAGFERERENLQVQLRVRDDELAAVRVVSDREQAALREKISALEAKRAELRSAFERIGDLRNQANEPQDDHRLAVHRPESEASLIQAPPNIRDPAVAESDAVVPKATLRQARAQFAYLAKECIPRGDIATQVMCELAAYTMDLALVSGQEPGHLPADEVALSILAHPGSAAPAIPNKL